MHPVPPHDLPDPLEHTVRRAEQMISKGEPLRDILARLTAAAELVSQGQSTASILIVDSEGLLRNGASPNLPADYLDAIDRLRPDPALGTCASAAATGEVVVTTDFQADEKWAELKHLPMSLGYHAAWSMPIKDPSGRVLGTFGTYFRERRAPTPDEMKAVSALVKIAAKAIGRSRVPAPSASRQG